MRAHQLDANGIVINTVVVDSLDVIAGLVEATIGGIGWTMIDGVLTPPPPPPTTRDDLKMVRQSEVEAIKVTTQSGKTFDGDEISQDRMARGILGLQAAGAESVTWVLADNTPIQVTATELGEALALAGAAQAAVWVIE